MDVPVPPLSSTPAAEGVLANESAAISCATASQEVQPKLMMASGNDAAAREETRLHETTRSPDRPTVAIIPGYRPGILGRTLEMHLDFYSQANGWGRAFEAGLATGIGDLLHRLDKPVNQAWSAVTTVTPAHNPQAPPVERIVGAVYVDGECMGEEGVARLRCLIVDESAKGLGAGGKLVRAAMDFVIETGFRECRLSTMRELTAARRLYEREGFKMVDETWLERFGTEVMELKYVWHRPGETAESNSAP